MPDIKHSLRKLEHGQLRLIAEYWGIQQIDKDDRKFVEYLCQIMRDPEQIDALLATLTPEASTAMKEIAGLNGKMSWGVFQRRYGELRDMGPARRDRIQPQEKPISITEYLYYRGIIARGFFDSREGLQEYAYIPDEILSRISVDQLVVNQPLGRPAIADEILQIFPANDCLLDMCCTLLAGLRVGLELDNLLIHWYYPDRPRTPIQPEPSQVMSLLTANNVLDAKGDPYLEATRAFLERERAQALAQLFNVWLESKVFNELHLLSGLRMDGEWQNDPSKARNAILEMLSNLPGGVWWSMDAFVEAVRDEQPDFQRTPGDYDAWHIWDVNRGEYLRGFEDWEAVDGALLRYIISGPLHWLGVTDIAFQEFPKDQEGISASAFRYSRWAEQLLDGKVPKPLSDEVDRIFIQSNGRLHVPWLVPRTARYQVARFCHWQGMNSDGYFYQITPTSLEQAAQQGIQMSHIQGLLNRYAKGVPPSLLRALERWEAFGREARIDQVSVLRLRHPEVLESLLNSPARRFLGDQLGATSVIVKGGAEKRILDILAEMGFLGEAFIE